MWIADSSPNYLEVEDPSSILVEADQSKHLTCKVGYDKSADFALFRLPRPTTVTFEIANSRTELDIGESVNAIGYIFKRVSDDPL